MTDVFALDTDGEAAMSQYARANPIRPEEVNAGTFTGVGTAVGMGTMRGGARVAQAVGLALAAPLVLYEQATGQGGRYSSPYFSGLDQVTTKPIDYWTPGPAEVGKAGQILGGLAEMALPLMAGGGDPAVLVGTQQLGTSADLIRQGVDADTAGSVGLIQGLSTAVGSRIPLAGKTLSTRLLAGAAGNLAVNVPTTEAQRLILQANDQPELAQRFDPLDPEARSLDVLTGLVFGGVGHFEARANEKAATAELERLRTVLRANGVHDALAAANNAEHFQSETAPGEPIDVASGVAHQRAMEQATEQLITGEPVTVPAEMAAAQFKPRTTPDPATTLANIREALPESDRAVTEITPDSALTDEKSAEPIGPGQPFLVLRAADRPGLQNANAGNVESVASFLVRLDDFERPQPIGSENTDKIFVYAVKHSDGFSPFVRYNQGKVERGKDEGGGRIGRQIGGKDIVYSFPDGGKFSAEQRLSIPISEVRDALKTEGYSNFDSAGGKITAKVLREVIARKLAQGTSAGTRIEDAPNFGLPEPPRTIPDEHPLLQPRHEDTSPERTAVREKIVQKALADAVPVEGRKPIAYVMGGGGASGKGTLLARLKETGDIPKHGAVEVDPDAVKEQLPEYKQIIALRDSRAAATVHEESSRVAKMIVAAAIKKRADIVLDRTMSGPKALDEIRDLKAEGYEVKLHGVTVAPESAIVRAVDRAKKKFRYVPLPDLLKAHKGFAQNFEKLAKVADEAVLYDNEVPQGTAPRTLAFKGRDGSLTVRDEKGYNAFRERSDINDKATTHRELAAGREAAAAPAGADRGNDQAHGSLDARGNAQGDGSGGQPVPAATPPGGVPDQGITAERTASQLSRRAEIDPELHAARELLNLRDIHIPTGETGPNGEIITRSAREILAEGDAAVERAKADAAAYDAAAACFLRGDAP